MTDDLFSRSDLNRVPGVDADALTFWIRQGLLVPVRAAEGRGRPLAFDKYQLRVAAILVAARCAALNVDALRAISEVLQQAIATFKRFGIDEDMVTNLIEEAGAAGSVEDVVSSIERVIARNPSDEVQAKLRRMQQVGYVERIKDAAAQVRPDEIEALWLFEQVWEGEGYLLIYRSIDENSWRVEKAATFDGGRLPASSCILIDLSRCVPGKVASND